MRRITISVLSMFVILPSFASARLPVVNVASGGVSARAMFGEGDVKTSVKTPVKTVAKAESTRTKKVVARTAKKAPVKNIDSGEQIVMANDVLVKRSSLLRLIPRMNILLRRSRDIHL